jgi:Lipopolysaccharide-assembly
MTRTWAPVAIAGALLCVACGYGLAGRGVSLPAHIKTIGVQPFTNRTPVADLDRTLATAVQNELQSRGRWKVIQGTSADVDAIVSGSIVSLTSTPKALNESRQASRIEIAVSASIEFKDVRENKVIWSSPAIISRDEYDVTTAASATDPSTFLRQGDARNRLAGAFARTVVRSMLEGM